MDGCVIDMPYFLSRPVALPRFFLFAWIKNLLDTDVWPKQQARVRYSSSDWE